MQFETHHVLHLIVSLCPRSVCVCVQACVCMCVNVACYQVTAKRFLLGTCHATLTSEPFFFFPILSATLRMSHFRLWITHNHTMKRNSTAQSMNTVPSSKPCFKRQISYAFFS